MMKYPSDGSIAGTAGIASDPPLRARRARRAPRPPARARGAPCTPCGSHAAAKRHVRCCLQGTNGIVSERQAGLAGRPAVPRAAPTGRLTDFISIALGQLFSRAPRQDVAKRAAGPLAAARPCASSCCTPACRGVPCNKGLSQYYVLSEGNRNRRCAKRSHVALFLCLNRAQGTRRYEFGLISAVLRSTICRGAGRR